MNHGYSYIGNTSMLCMTEFTEDCFLYFTHAVANKRPTFCLGHAGTGKTETVKDAAKKLGINSKVVACSDQFSFEEVKELI